MAFLLFLTGERVDDTVELNPAATLTIGSSTEAHIQLLDPEVAAVHGQIYPAEGRFWFQDLGQGYTYLNLDPVANATQPLSPHDVLIVGRTFLKFVLERPKARGGDDRAKRQVEGLKREVDRLRGRLTEYQAEAGKARREAKQAEVELEKARETLRAEREASDRLTAPVFDGADASAELEAGLRTLRARASELATELAVEST